MGVSKLIQLQGMMPSASYIHKQLAVAGTANQRTGVNQAVP